MKLDDIRKSNPNIPNPKKQSDYEMTSNQTGEKIQMLFDYDTLNNDHKTAASEIIALIEERKNLPTNILQEEIRNRFKLSEIPMMKVEDTLWYELTKDEALGPSIQGFRVKINEDGSKVRIPYIAFSSDLEYLNEMVMRLMNKILDMVKKEHAGKI